MFVKLLVLHLQTSATNVKHRFHWFLLRKVKSSKEQENIFKSVFYSSVMLMSLLKIGQLSSFFLCTGTRNFVNQFLLCLKYQKGI